jgi:SpoIIAA-like
VLLQSRSFADWNQSLRTSSNSNHLENFEGWEGGADWGNDLDFLFLHSGKISKIAIVAESRWETLALAFAGAGVRRAPVKFFPPNELEQARSWLAE